MYVLQARLAALTPLWNIQNLRAVLVQYLRIMPGMLSVIKDQVGFDFHLSATGSDPLIP